MESKDDLRKRLKAERAELGEARRAALDEAIFERLKDVPAYRDAEWLFPYLSFGAEVDTRAIIRDAWNAGKAVAIPRCNPGRRMSWYRVQSFDGLVLSSFGVEEPPDDHDALVEPSAVANAVAIVPGLEFDEAGFRLGYGGGFYDTFLTDFKGVSVGLCRDCFLQKRLTTCEPHDKPVDIVVTDMRTLLI